jgi:hypothetical protein
LALETAAIQAKPAYAGYKILDFWLVHMEHGALRAENRYTKGIFQPIAILNHL